MNQAPSISVVIPCYNASAWLRETLESALAQTLPPLEIIVVDDGSTDGSGEIAASFGEPVRVIRQENQGESVARNRGLDEARGEWTALLDADDLWEPDKLARQAGMTTKETSDLVCVYTDFYQFRGSERLRTVSRPEYHQRDDGRPYMLCLSDATVLVASALVRTSAARRVRFPEETQHAEDMIFFARLRSHGRFVRIAEPLTGYRVSANAQTQAPDFRLRSVESRFSWFLENADGFSADECRTVRELLSAQLVEAHDLAFWNRRHDVVRRCREFHLELEPDGPLPESFRWRLLPALALRCKDALDSLFRTRREEPSPS